MAIALYAVALQHGVGIAWSSAVAALLLGLVSYPVAARTRIPTLVVVAAGITPFLPGLSIYRGLIACDVARRFSEHRFLVRDAPPLPLTGCTMSKTCQCKYIKHKDRRSEPRRLIDFGVATRLFDGKERRALNRRRNRD